MNIQKILIIDDDIIDRKNIKRSIERSVHDVKFFEADTAESGLALAQNNTFDVILLDYRLPTITGLALLVELRKSTNNKTAVVMLSHNEDQALGDKCIEAGAQDFICKSEVTASRLLRSILHANEIL